MSCSKGGGMFLASSSELTSLSYKRPEECARLLLKCPNSISGDCVIVRREWQCAKCLTAIDHGFDRVFYCNCGAGPAFSYSFKCSDHFHGDSFVKFSEADMISLLPVKRSVSSSTATTDGCLNILLLGESGVGKSTFINAFVNYLTFASLDEALEGDLRSPIYSTFITSTEDGDEQEVSVGEPDSWENCSAASRGESCTQKCRAYKFSTGDQAEVHLIDTPGIGDTRGFDQDMENVKDIISFISEYDVLHAILILLRPNVERLTMSLRYCVNEVLAHLHKEAIENIHFCFTNSRSTMFRPGNTTQLLKVLLSQNPQTAGIKIDKSTMYFFDSEAFRFLAARKSGITFSEQDKQDYVVSWSRSIEQSEKLIARVASLKPHAVEKTVSLNNVRDFIATIEIPLETMSRSIQSNIESISRQRKDLDEYYRGTSETVRSLVIVTESSKTVALGHLRTVCKRCNRSGDKPFCHNCSAKESRWDILDQYFGMYMCEAFRWDEVCKVCGCAFGLHTRVATETTKEISKTVDEDVEQAIRMRRSKEEVARLSIRKLEEKEKSFREEMEETLSAAVLFTGFVMKNSLVKYNPATEDYLEELIKVKKSLPDTDDSKAEIKRLQISLDKFRKQIDKYRSRQTSQQSQITSEDIQTTLEKLYALKENGEQLKANIETVKRSYEAYRNARTEAHHVLKNKSNAEPGFASKVTKILKNMLRPSF